VATVSSGLHIDERPLAALCMRTHVRTLELFGSATDGRFDPAHSDLDLLVQFESLPPAEHADSYFGLLEGLEALFGRPVDLVELSAIRNPYLLRAIQAGRVRLYAA